MTHTPDSLPLQASSGLRERFDWVIKERDPKTGLYLPVKRGRNVHTSFGTTAYASGFQGSYSAPLWMAIDTFAPTLVSLSGATLVLTASQQPTLTGDTGIALSVGTANQEVVTISGPPTVAGSNYTYTMTSTPSFSHPVGDICVRNPLITDTSTSLFTEIQYDTVNAPGQRMQSIGGYSPGAGSWTMQFFFTGAMALVNFVSLALMDNVLIGQGNMHNHLYMGYNHTVNNDAEVDVTLTLTNS